MVDKRVAALKRRGAAGGRPKPPPKPSPFVDALTEAVTARVLAALEPKLAQLRVGLADLALRSSSRRTNRERQ